MEKNTDVKNGRRHESYDFEIKQAKNIFDIEMKKGEQSIIEKGTVSSEELKAELGIV